ncbi:MAG: PQQ-binding-like beta-propeller repeat protein, partial [Pirellulaceae bacterium]
MILLLILPALISADDWPQWMGPQRDSEWRETGIVTRFPAGGPPVLWRVPVSGGYAGPAVADGRVFVTDYVVSGGQSSLDFNNRDRLRGTERVTCLDAASGKQLWRYTYPCDYNISYATGPRCTPTVFDGRVYTLGAEGRLLCLNATSGKVLWQRDLKQDYQTETPLWGFCAHPLVE